MSNEEIEVLVVGAGQAGVAISEHLGAQAIPHLILERDRIAERWRTGRWDSLVANGPAWHDRFPGLSFSQVRPRRFRVEGPGGRLPGRLRGEDRGADAVRGGGAASPAQRRPARVPRADIRRNRSMRGMSWRRRGHSRSRSFPRWSPRTRTWSRSIPARTATPANCPRAPCWWSGPDRRECRSRTSCAGRADRSTSRSGRTTGPRAGTGAATSAGGSAFSTSGRWRRHPVGRSTSRSRSAARTVATPSTSAPLRPTASPWSGGPSRTPAAPCASRRTCGATSRGGDADLPVDARRGRRLRRAQRPRPSGGAVGPRPSDLIRTAWSTRCPNSTSPEPA